MEKIVETDGKGNKVESRSIAGETHHNVSGVKQCKKCQTLFTITDRDIEFYDKISPVFNGKKYSVPTPTHCPTCRNQRRLAGRNERSLYRRKCDLTGKNVISAYSPDKPYIIYEQESRRSDKRNPLDYGQYFDSNRTFFDQFYDLTLKVPRQNLTDINSENSEYCNISADNKNCYLSFGIRTSEDVYYSKWIDNGRDCVDCSFIYYCEVCYQCVESKFCFKSNYLVDCNNCNNCDYCFSSKDCNNCVGCTNLVNKENHILNKPASKGLVKETVKKLYTDQSFFDDFKKKYNELLKKTIREYAHIIKCENCSGDYLQNCKNCSFIYQGIDCEDCKYMDFSDEIKDCMDSTAQKGGERTYEVFSSLQTSNVISCTTIRYCNRAYYCDCCFNSSDLFGCVGLNNKQYCILNKQYSKKEYEKLVPQIINHMQNTGEWGEYFSSKISPYGYNETVAMEDFPITKQEAIKKGFEWSDYEAPFPQVEKTLKSDELAYDIDQTTDDILDCAIQCEITGKPFRIMKPELDFYRKQGLPLPRRHPDVRHTERLQLRNPRKKRDRKCDKCDADIKTSYSPERPEIVYCEACYNREIYG